MEIFIQIWTKTAFIIPPFSLEILKNFQKKLAKKNKQVQLITEGKHDFHLKKSFISKFSSTFRCPLNFKNQFSYQVKKKLFSSLQKHYFFGQQNSHYNSSISFQFFIFLKIWCDWHICNDERELKPLRPLISSVVLVRFPHKNGTIFEAFSLLIVLKGVEHFWRRTNMR